MNKVPAVLALLALIYATGCLKEGKMKKPYKGFTPHSYADGWATSSPSAEKMDSASLERIYEDVIADDGTWMMKSLLVFRNKKLIAESYFKDEADRTRRAPIWSCTKQVNAIITGISIGEGYIAGEDDLAEKYLPEYFRVYPDKKGLTLKHLLTMKSGTSFDNGGYSDIFRQHKTGNSVSFVLGLELKNPIGTTFHYNDGDPQVISAIVQKATGLPMDEYGKRVLFEPLGIKNYEWVRYTDGVTMGAWGIMTTPRELAKIGQCVLDSGRYNDQQIIPKDWWFKMLSAQVPNAHGDAAFGYYWWSIPAKGWYFMWGHGGQYVFLNPGKRLMVVATSLPQLEDDFALWYEKIVSLAEKIEATAY